jgi:hypothetical protein
MKEVFRGLIFAFLVLLIFVIFLSGASYLTENSECNQLNEEGYLVRFDFDWQHLYDCKILVNNLDGSTTWRAALGVDEFTIENYGVKK